MRKYGTIISLLLSISDYNNKFDEYQHHQLQHKKVPQDIQFFDEHGQQITYEVNHEHTTADTCNDFYPIHCQQNKDQKILRLHNDGEHFSLNSIGTNLATPSLQLAADCFRKGRTMNQLDGYADHDLQYHYHHLKFPPKLTALSVQLRQKEPKNPDLFEYRTSNSLGLWHWRKWRCLRLWNQCQRSLPPT